MGKRNFTAAVFAAFGLALAGPAAAQMAMENAAPAACSTVDAALPSPLQAWTSKAPLTSATAAAGLDGASLTLGKAYAATLHATPQVTYVAQPEKPGGTVSHGGLFALNVIEAGTYRIALGAAPWIDVLKDGKPLTSAAHGHGPACSSVRKMVDFALQPGRYVVQVSADADETLAIMAVRAP